MTDQRKIISIIEVCLNVASGFILAMLVWAYIIPILFPRLAGPIIENLWITSTFTVVSVLRGYFWRRFFANGIHRIVALWVRGVAGAISTNFGGSNGST